VLLAKENATSADTKIQMRKLTTRIIVLLVVAQWLSTVDILVLVAGMGILIATMVCVDLLFGSRAG
jgi:hypothetical protein